MSNLPRMRFPHEVVEELRRIDPGSRVTVAMIRRMMAQGAIPCVPVGSGTRKLTNLDAVITYFTTNAATPEPERTGLRVVAENNKYRAGRAAW